MSNPAYLLYLIPVTFIVLSRMYFLKFNKVKGTGKIPRIIEAKNRQNLFLFLAIVSTMFLLAVVNLHVFAQDSYHSW